MKSLVFFGGALALNDSAVNKVIQLLGELKGKVQAELDGESKLMEEYEEWCDDEIKEKQYAIKTAKSDIEGFEAVIEESVGKVQSLTTLLESSAAEISAKNGELNEATELRAKEHKDFSAAEKELVDSVDMLARAATVLKRELSFAQGAQSKAAIQKKLGSMLTGIKAIVESAWVDSASASKIKAFLETDDELSLKQPQASSYNYESKSGGIVDTILDMKDKAQDQLASLRKDETKARHAFEMLSQGLNDSIANLNKTVAQAQNDKAAAAETQGKAEEDLAKTQDSLAADESYLSKTQQACQIKSQEWEVRQKSAADEMAALDKAKEILAGGVKVMLAQTSATVERRVVSKSADNRDELVHALRKLGRKFNSFALLSLAGRAQSDPFVKVRGLINDMIAKLEKQAAEEATQEAFCQEENAKSKKKRDSVSAEVDKYSTRLEKAKAGVETLELEIADLTKQLADMAEMVGKATKVRAEENALYKKNKQDQSESVAAVAQAIQVLQEFYGGAAFVQQPEFSGKKSDSASGIISFLEVAQSDFSTLLAETEADEKEAVEAFEQLSQASAVSRATKESSIKGKTSEIQSLKVAIENTSSDLGNANKELDAVLEYIEKLKPQCESKAMTYAERKAARDSEIAGLKEALEILDVDEPAAFLQTRNKKQVFLGL